jgi:hypothetical protein
MGATHENEKALESMRHKNNGKDSNQHRAT